MSREQKVAEAQRLRAEGLKQREIAERMGVARSTAGAYLNDPDGSRLRARKDSYRGECETCGAPTDGSNGREAAPTRCAACRLKAQTKTERNERIVEMWEAGEPTWYIAEQVGETEQVIRAWVEHARRLRGRPLAMRRLSPKQKTERFALIAERVRSGRSNQEIAEELGTSRESVNNMAHRARREGFDMPYRSEVEQVAA